MTRILVTGATGFLGAHLTRRLVQQGHSVRALVRATSQTRSLEEWGVARVVGDLSDVDSVHRAVEGVDWVFHLAGLIGAHGRRALLQANGWGTAHVADACARQAHPPVLVYVSSVAAVGPAWRHRLRTEHDVPSPVSQYGWSKRAGEIAVERRAAGVPTTIVRPGIVFGPEGREMFPIFQSIDRLHLHIVAGQWSPRLSLIDVEDLATLLIAAAERGARVPGSGVKPDMATGRYFACCPEYPDYFQFGRLVQQALAQRYVAFLHIPVPIPWLVGCLAPWLTSLFGASSALSIDKIREALADSWACSCAAAERELGFRPTQTLAEQLRGTARWYREHGWL
jgi:nucleoside-diphosphate-sugar epimerase